MQKMNSEDLSLDISEDEGHRRLHISTLCPSEFKSLLFCKVYLHGRSPLFLWMK